MLKLRLWCGLIAMYRQDFGVSLYIVRYLFCQLESPLAVIEDLDNLLEQTSIAVLTDKIRTLIAVLSKETPHD